MLNDAVKKGGVMASSSVGGLSGAFIPVSEDAGMIRAAEAGALSLEKLEAMTCVCSVGLDMIAIPGDTSIETIFGIIADECAIGMINNKTTAVRVIPAIGKKVGDRLGVRRPARLRPRHARQPKRGHRVRPSRRPHARAFELAEELGPASAREHPEPPDALPSSAPGGEGVFVEGGTASPRKGEARPARSPTGQRMPCNALSPHGRTQPRRTGLHLPKAQAEGGPMKLLVIGSEDRTRKYLPNTPLVEDVDIVVAARGHPTRTSSPWPPMPTSSWRTPSAP